MKKFDGISTAALIRRDGSYLLAKRKPGTSIGESWEFPGGKAEPGEAPESALERELLEELSVKARAGKLVFRTQFENKGKLYGLLAFEVSLDSRDLTLSEHSEVGYFTPDEMGRLDMAGSDRQIADFIQNKPETEIKNG